MNSVGDNAGQVLTINTGTGFSAGQTIVFDINGKRKSASLNNNQSSYPTLDREGIILDPAGAISLVNANLIGRVYGGDSHNMQIVSGDNITQPPAAAPEPSTLSFALIGLLLGGFGLAKIRRRGDHSPASEPLY